MTTSVTLPVDTTGYARIVLTYTSLVVSDQGLASEYINNATVTFTLTDQAGTVLIDALSIPYITDSDGVYAAAIPADSGIDYSTLYEWSFTATLPGGIQLVEQGCTVSEGKC